MPSTQEVGRTSQCGYRHGDTPCPYPHGDTETLHKNQTRRHFIQIRHGDMETLHTNQTWRHTETQKHSIQNLFTD